MTERDLLREIASYTQELQKEPSQRIFARRGTVHLELGNFDQAMADYKAAEEINQNRFDRHDAWLQKIGMALWMKGERKSAAEIWKSTIDEIEKGKILFSDLAGGLLNGTLLWFASIYPEANDFKAFAEEFIRKKIKSQDINIWPRPIGHYLVENLSGAELLKLASSESKQLEYRQLSQAYFYIAAKALLNQDREVLKQSLTASVEHGSKNPLENEYYLAQFELKRLK